jgi:hypothetical protein
LIFDPKNGALYADDGEFLKTVYCPLALQAQDLEKLTDTSPDRQCHACKETIRCADNMNDLDMKVALKEDPNLCIFATPAAKHIIVLKPIGLKLANEENLPVIQTARSIAAMKEGFRRGFRVVIGRAGPESEIGSKCKLFQHEQTGEVWSSGDFRSNQPDEGDARNWRLVADWFYYRPDWPFPYAAYLVPKDLQRGQRVYLEDLIEDVPYEVWNQGDSERVVSLTAMWNGDEFEVEHLENLCPMVG